MLFRQSRPSLFATLLRSHRGMCFNLAIRFSDVRMRFVETHIIYSRFLNRHTEPEMKRCLRVNQSLLVLHFVRIDI